MAFNRISRVIVIGILAAMTALAAPTAFGSTVFVVDEQVSSGSDDAYDAPVGFWPGSSTIKSFIYAGAPGSGELFGGWRWSGLGIPADAVITDVSVELNQYEWGTGITSILTFEDTASPATFSLGDSPADRWSNRTTFETSWSWGPQSPGTWITTPALTAGVQELVDTYGAIDSVVLVEAGIDVSSGAYHQWAAYNGDPARAAKIHIEYTTGGPDINPPNISNVLVSGITETSATISWTTNEISDSTVNYGTTTALGSTESDGTYVISHSVTLSGLTSDTGYLFEVQSTDVSLNVGTDDNSGALYSFNTLAPPPPPVISDVLASSITDISVIISWSTDVSSDSTVNYGTTTALGLTEFNATLVTSHSMIISGLLSDMTYFFEVESTGLGGTTTDNNGGVLYSFDTLPPPPAPAISGVLVTDVTDASVTISWGTDVSSDSAVNYGTSTALGSTEFDATLVTSHSVAIAGLLPDTTYFFEVVSTSTGGTTVDDNSSALYSFATLAEPVGISFSAIVVSKITATSVTISWDTDFESIARVERVVDTGSFGICPTATHNSPGDDYYCSVRANINPMTISHALPLTNLQPNTTYQFRAIAQFGALEENFYSAVNSFTTLPPANGILVDGQVSSGSDDAYDAPVGFWPGYSGISASMYAGAPGSGEMFGGWRWEGLVIPADAVIKEAWVELNQYEYGTGFTTVLALEDTASPATFSSSDSPADRWSNRTTFEVAWPWAHQSPGAWVRTASLVDGIQELVDTYGAIDSVVFVEAGIDVSSGKYHRWASYNGDPTRAAKIHIEYTTGGPDINPPNISNVLVSGITETSATISWNTNEFSDSAVNYGTTAALGSTESDASLVISHSITLSGLTSDTGYLFEVRSTDLSSNIGTDDNSGALYSFNTLAPPPPPVISDVLASSITDISVIISWSTDVFSDSTVRYGTSTALGMEQSDATLVTSHSEALGGLLPDTTYFFEVESTGEGGTMTDDNGAALYSFDTLPLPPAPSISVVAASDITETSVTISWDTDVFSDSTVRYGTSTALGLVQSDATLVTSHSEAIGGLLPDTTYFFEVESTSTGGTTTDDNSSALYSFAALAEPEGISFTAITVSKITATSVTISWDTNVETIARVERAVDTGSFETCPDASHNSPGDDYYCTVRVNINPKTLSHAMPLMDLQPNTTYQFRAIAQLDALEENFYSAVNSFTTLPAANGTMVDGQVSSGSDDAYDAPVGFWPGSSTIKSFIYSGAPSGGEMFGGWRWEGLVIPADAVIKEAWVELNQYAYGTGFTTVLAFEDTSSPATFSISDSPADRWSNRTTFEVAWPWAHQSPGAWVRTASLVDGIQELVDTYGAIDSIVFIEAGIDVSSGTYHQWAAYNGDPSRAAKLHVEYTVP